jgi:O-antigen/teichoic acid export membrane protein
MDKSKVIKQIYFQSKKSLAILTLSRMVSKIISLITMLAVVRQLKPKEVGVFSLSALVIGAFDQLSETGLRSALISHAGKINGFVAPVRSVQILRGVIIGLAVFVSAPFISKLFNEPQVSDIIRVSALIPIIQGAEPLVETMARRELNFKPIFLTQSISSLLGLIIGLISANAGFGVWALVYSNLVRVATCVVAYHLISGKEDLQITLKWAPLKDLRKFSFWFFINTLNGFIFLKSFEFFVARELNIEELAFYQVAYAVATTVTGEFAAILNSLTFPMFSKLRSHPEELLKTFRNIFGITSIITFYLASFLFSCSSIFIEILLGSQWIPAGRLVPWLSVWAVVSVFSNVISGLIHAIGLPEMWAKTGLVMTCLMAITAYPMIRSFGSFGAASVLAGIGLTMLLWRFSISARLLKINYSKIFVYPAIPMVACMAATIAGINMIELTKNFSNLVQVCMTTVGLTLVYFLGIYVTAHHYQTPSERCTNFSDFLRSLKNINI